MKNRQGIVWAPILIIVACVLVAGVAGYFLFKAGSSNKTENANVAVVNQANSNTVANTNTTTNTLSNTNTATDSTAGWKTYISTERQISFKYPSEWPAWGKEETTKYSGKKEFYPPSGEYITRTGKHLQVASGGTSNDPLHFFVSDSNDFTRGGDGACSDIYHCWAPLATTAIAKACSEKKYEGASFVGCTTVDGAQALTIIANDVDLADYYLLVFFDKTYNGYDRWMVGEQLQSSSGFPQDSVREGLLKGIESNQHKKDLYTLLSTWKADPTAGWKTYTNSKYRFSFKYPQNWKPEEVTVIDNGACARAPSTDSVFCVIPDGSTTDDGNVISTETVTVAGQSAKHTVRKNLGGTNLPNYDYYVFTSYRSHGWTANNNLTVEPKSSDDIETLKTILSTFQFTN